MRYRPEPNQQHHMLDLSGSKALVTGAGGGIGGSIALTLAGAGAAVALHSRRSGAGADKAAALAERLQAEGTDAVVVQADLADPDDTRGLVGRAAEQLGGLDILVNNAADNALGPIPATWDELRLVNIDAVVALGRAFGALADSSNTAASCIINIASIEGHQPVSGRANYATTKAALLMWTKALASELGPKNVRVNSISPGLIEREGLEEAWPEGVARWKEAAPLARLGQPLDIANACLFLASPLAAWITGTDLVVDGGVLARPTW